MTSTKSCLALSILVLCSVKLPAATLYVDANGINSTASYANWTTAATNIQDAVNAAAAGDQIWVTNGIYQFGGGYFNGSNRVSVTTAIALQSVNGPSVTVIEGEQSPTAVRCVHLVSGALLAGFTLTNGSVSTFGPGGGGVYCQSVGVGTPSAVVSNCIIVGNQCNGQGGGAYSGILKNCVITGNVTKSTGSGAFLGGGAASSILYNCSIISNTAVASGSGRGGGLYSCTASNCMIANNFSDFAGGGADAGRMVNCMLINNAVVNTNSPSAFAEGGGSADGASLTNCIVVSNSVSGGVAGSDYGGGCGPTCTLVNCTVVGNSALGPNGSAGGVENSAVYNCIIYYNTAATSPNSSQTLVGSCTTPLSAGEKNITNAPLFVNMAGGDFHLQSNSLCINSGENFFNSLTNDLDGNPRIQGGTVDIGAYEYQTPTSILSYAWAQQYGLPTDGSADYLDLDGTGMQNWQKSVAGLNPTNPASVLAMLPTVTTNSSGLTVTWQSVNTRIYFLQRATNLTAQPAFSTIKSYLDGQAGTTSYTDSTATAGGPYFYRVGVK
jgi:hypothetical protein